MSKSVHSFDEAYLTAWLEEHMEGFKGPLEARKFDDGQSNPTFLIEAASGKYVLRRKPPGTLLGSAHAVDREFRVLKALEHSDVPVATPHVLCEDDDVIGSMFYVMSFEDGRIFWDMALPEVPSENRRAIYSETVRVLAAMHSLDLEAVGLADYGKPGSYFERQLSRWTKQYRAAETEHIPAVEELIVWLSDNLPEDDGQISLIHGDYKPDNLIFHPTETKAIAVLDWELSTLGHPYADIAYLCALMRLPVFGTVKGLDGKDRTALNLPSEAEVVAEYCKLRGIDRIDHWHFYLTFSLFRLVGIMQGVYKRALDGNASHDNALQLGKGVSVLANLALGITKEG